MNSFVSGDGTGTNGSCQAVNNFFVSGGNGSHVGRAMAEDMGEGFAGFTVAAGGISIRPAVFYGIRGYAVEAGSMYEAPVFKANIESGVMPRRSVGEAISCKSLWGLALVTEISQSGGGSVTGEVVQKAAGVFCKHRFVIVRGSDGQRAIVWFVWLVCLAIVWFVWLVWHRLVCLACLVWVQRDPVLDLIWSRRRSGVLEKYCYSHIFFRAFADIFFIIVVQELLPNTKFLYDLHSPKGKHSYEVRNL